MFRVLKFFSLHCDYCIDICEDPELRERILQLRSEQETKRLQETKKRGVNRSQSNTRTQSVRRTSIRDKTIITKKDAVEEARRLAQEVSNSNFESDVGGIVGSHLWLFELQSEFAVIRIVGSIFQNVGTLFPRPYF